MKYMKMFNVISDKTHSVLALSISIETSVENRLGSINQYTWNIYRLKKNFWKFTPGFNGEDGAAKLIHKH